MNIEYELKLPSPYPVSFIEILQHKGPTDESFWVVLNKILCGPFPGGIDDRIHIAYIGTLLRCGCSTFVCLCEEFDPLNNDKQVSNGLRQYFDVVNKLYYDEHFWDDYQSFKPKKIDLLYFPMEHSCKYKNNNQLYEFCLKLVNRVKNEECLYIHSLDGNNRAFFISTIVLMLLNNYYAEDSIKIMEAYYEQRAIRIEQGQLLSKEQIKQIKSIYTINKEKLKRKK